MTRKVKFADYDMVYEYVTFVPCLQDTLAQWQNCKVTHLQTIYCSIHGTLNGFDFEKACRSSDEEDKLFEAEDVDTVDDEDDADTTDDDEENTIS
jgi:hypothetical protein